MKKNYRKKNNSFMGFSLRVFYSICFCFVFKISAANIYVDSSLAQDITNGTYSTQKRDNTGSDGNAYRRVQSALNAMKGGDAVFMRRGVYREGVITVPINSSGDSLHWSSLQSFPGEWAVLDGENRLPTDPCFVLGYACMSTSECEHHYWKFERFEVRNGSCGGSARGIWISGGPFVFRYLYIHDNNSGNSGDNPSGLRSYRMQNSIIEHCYFKNNGGFAGDGMNCAHIAIFTDYAWQNDSLRDINHAARKNEIRYNLFDSSYVGFKHKGAQLLTKNRTGDMTYKDFGDKIHHNIFLNHVVTIDNAQDFAQYYNNISTSGQFLLTEECATCKDKLFVTAYNNTIIRGALILPFAYGSPPSNFHPYVYCSNNIVDSVKNSWESSGISVGLTRNSITQTLVTTDCKIDRNLIYRPVDATNFVMGSNAGNGCMGFLTTAKMNSCYAVANYTTSLPGLFKGTAVPDRFRTNGAFTLSSAGATITNGGIGGNHPYLDGVKLPTYVGAVDPNDDGWVNTVMDLANLGQNAKPSVTDVSLWRGKATYCDSIDTIRWTANDDKGVAVCSLWVTRDNGAAWTFLLDTLGTVNKYTWKVNPPPGMNCQIRVRAYDSEGKYGEGKSAIFKISYSQKKSLVLKASAITDTSAKVSWYASIPDSTPIDNIGIFYNKTGYAPLTDHRGWDSITSPLLANQDTIINLSRRATYYFTAFFPASGGTWESGGDSAQASLIMPDLTPPQNNFSLQAAKIDSTSIALSWKSLSGGSDDAESLAICYRTDTYPALPGENGSISVLRAGLFPSADSLWGLPTNTVYYFALFIKDSTGNWSTATTAGKARVALSNRKKSLIVTAQALNETAVHLQWSFSDPDSEGVQFIGIFYKTVGFPTDPGLAGSDSVVGPITALQDTILNLTKRATYYFSAYFRTAAGTWQSGGNSAQVSVRLPDLTPPENNFSLSVSKIDSSSIALSWQPIVQGSSDADSLGICFRTDFYPIAMREKGSVFIDQALPVASQDTVSGLSTNTVYYFSLFVKDSSGNWSAATDSARKRMILSSSGNKISLPAADTIRFFKDTLALWAGPEVPAFTDTINWLASIPSLKGFIQYSPCYYFNNGKLLSSGAVGIRLKCYDKIAPYPRKNIRIYRFNTENGKILLEKGPGGVDTVHGAVSVFTNDLRFPFIALLDTLRPSIRVLSGQDPVSGSSPVIFDTLSFSDNAGNPTYSFFCAAGNAALKDFPDSLHEIVSGDSVIRSSVPRDVINACSGYHAVFEVSDGVFNESVELSRPVIRESDNCDNMTAASLQWSPVHVTALPDSHNAQKVLDPFLDPANSFKYDKSRCRMIRWYPCPINSAVAEKWVEFGDVDNSIFAIVPGALIWLKTKKENAIDFGPAITASLRDSAVITLDRNAWTDFALPFAFPVLIEDIIAATQKKNPGLFIDSLEIYRWKISANSYATEPVYLSEVAALASKRDSLVNGPEAGYSVYNPLQSPVRLYFPPSCPAISAPTGTTDRLNKKKSNDAWSVSIDFFIKKPENENSRLGPLYCGYYKSDMKKQPTYYPISPSLTPVSVRIFDRLNDRMFGHEVVHDFSDNGTIFELAFCNNTDSVQVLSFGKYNGTNLPSSIIPVLFNPHETVKKRSSAADSIIIAPHNRTIRLLAIGSKEYLNQFELGLLKQKTMLDATYPNPFRRSIKISFSLPYTEVRQVSFELFGINGRLIAHKEIFKGFKPGNNRFIWNGIAPSGNRLAVGMYLFKMSVVHSESNTVEVFKKRLTCLP